MDLRDGRPVMSDRRGCDDSNRTRRRWIGETALVLSGVVSTAWGQDPAKSKAGPGEQATIDQVQARAKKARLAPFGISRSPHFLCIGDATKAYREDALAICEATGKTSWGTTEDADSRSLIPTAG